MEQHTGSGTSSKGDASTIVKPINSDAVAQAAVKVTPDGEAKSTDGADIQAASTTASSRNYGAVSTGGHKESKIKNTDDGDVAVALTNIGTSDSTSLPDEQNKSGSVSTAPATPDAAYLADSISSFADSANSEPVSTCSASVEGESSIEFIQVPWRWPEAIAEQWADIAGRITIKEDAERGESYLNCIKSITNLVCNRIFIPW
jgi:hypothetical protein